MKRKTSDEIKMYLNQQISTNPKNWQEKKGANFGIPLQELFGKYYKDHSTKLNISKVDINTNPNDTRPDIEIHYTNGCVRGIEVKSCKDGRLGGVTICNSPELINDKEATLINYTFEDGTLHVTDVIFTQIFRLITINSTGKYKGCLKSTRDTGKKIKGRNYNEFINTTDEDDYSLEELTEPSLIRKTILYHSASKLVDDRYNFSNEEILEAIINLKQR